MKYRKLGRTDIEISTVGMGCWAITGDFTWGPQDRDDAVAALKAAVDAGINFLDTAEGYGRGQSESLIGEVLSPFRKDLVIATKVSGRNLKPGALAKACTASLRRLRTDYIDLYQIHWPNRQVPLADTLGAMERLRAEGKVRAIGVSNFGVGYLNQLADAGRAESDQLCYSLLWRAIEHEVQPICQAEQMSILCYSPLCQGLLTGKFATADDVPAGRARNRLFAKDRPHCRHDEAGCEDEVFEALSRIRRICRQAGVSMTHAALAWLLARPAVGAVIAGARSPAQVVENAQAADVELPADVTEQLSAATEKVKDYVGTNADMWQSDSRMEP